MAATKRPRRHPKELSAITLAAFRRLVPSAKPHKGREAVFDLIVGGTVGTVRVKRAERLANQVHVWHGEPLVLHVPYQNNDDPLKDRWFVVPVAWQLSFALKHSKDAAQHAAHAFDCMYFEPGELDEKYNVPLADLTAACEQAIQAARDPIVRIMVKATTRARDAVANALIQTLQEELKLE